MKKKKTAVKTKKAVKKVLKKKAVKPAKKTKVAAKKAVKKVIKKAVKPAVKPAKKTVKAAVGALKPAVELPEQVGWIVKCLDDRKAGDIRLFNVSQTAGLWEYYVVCSGMSSTHVSALRDNLKKEMGEKGLIKSHEDRDPENMWIVVDFGDILVHIFEKETRSRFALETTMGPTEVSLSGIIKK